MYKLMKCFAFLGIVLVVCIACGSGSAEPTPSRIGEEIALFTKLIVEFDPPIEYRILTDDTNSLVCANGTCAHASKYDAGDIVKVHGLACSTSIWYQIFGSSFLLGESDEFLPDFADLEPVAGHDVADDYECP